jgi:hypothetical protein
VGGSAGARQGVVQEQCMADVIVINTSGLNLI